MSVTEIYIPNSVVALLEYAKGRRSPLTPLHYCIVRYSHDRASGESLNVGVIVYCYAESTLKIRTSSGVARLKNAFAGFDDDTYVRTLGWLETAVAVYQKRFAPGTLFSDDKEATLTQILNHVWPDNGLSLYHSETYCGVTEDVDAELEYLYQRFVSDLYQPKVARPIRDDAQVWQSYNTALREKGISEHLRQKTFKIKSFEYAFDYAFKNGQWQTLLPITMDYAVPQSMRDRATKLIGEAQLLSKHSDIGKIYYLLGSPSNSSHKQAYNDAIDMLKEVVPISHEVVEEEQKEEFAESLSDRMQAYGIIEK